MTGTRLGGHLFSVAEAGFPPNLKPLRFGWTELFWRAIYRVRWANYRTRFCVPNQRLKDEHHPVNIPGVLQRYSIFYGWVVVFVCFVVIGLAFGVRLSFGIFFEALTRSGDEFTWSRADTAGVFSAAMMVFALTSTFFGWMLDRMGPRPVFVLGILVMVSGLAFTSRMTNLLQFTLFYGVWTGLGITILGLAVQAATISRWFDRAGRRGLAIGIAFSGTGVGILILAPLLERSIAFWGWRQAYLLLAALLFFVALPLVWLFMRNEPSEIGLVADGQALGPSSIEAIKNRPTRGRECQGREYQGKRSEQTWTFAVALRTTRFWLLMLCGACSLFSLRMVTVHQVAHLVDHGVARLTAATVIGGAGLITALSFIVFGQLSDRIGRARTFAIGSVAQLAALALLMNINFGVTNWFLYTYALLWGIGEGSRSGLLTAVANDTFPGPSQGAIVGALGAFFGVGSALGSWYAGWVYDQYANYLLALRVAAAATVIATAAVVLVQGRKTQPILKNVQKS